MYYAVHIWGKPIGRTLTFVLCEMAFVELTYCLDTTAVTLSYLTVNFQDLGRHVKKVCCDKSFEPRQKKQKLMILFGDWVVPKRVTEGVSHAAAPHLIPHLFWDLSSTSLKTYYFMHAESNQINSPVQFWFQVVSVIVRVIIVVLLCIVGQSVSSKVSKDNKFQNILQQECVSLNSLNLLYCVHLQIVAPLFSRHPTF